MMRMMINIAPFESSQSNLVQVVLCGQHYYLWLLYLRSCEWFSVRQSVILLTFNKIDRANRTFLAAQIITKNLGIHIEHHLAPRVIFTVKSASGSASASGPGSASGSRSGSRIAISISRLVFLLLGHVGYLRILPPPPPYHPLPSLYSVFIHTICSYTSLQYIFNIYSAMHLFILYNRQHPKSHQYSWYFIMATSGLLSRTKVHEEECISVMYQFVLGTKISVFYTVYNV